MCTTFPSVFQFGILYDIMGQQETKVCHILQNKIIIYHNMCGMHKKSMAEEDDFCII
jgi:hypothetical protein